MNFARQKAIGRRWEERWARTLAGRGYSVVPTWLLDGERGEKAPALITDSDPVVIPDLLAFKENQQSRWFECKYKSRTDFYRRGGYPVTGFSRRLFREYEKVGRITGLPVFVAFLHSAENEVRGGALPFLRSCVSHVHEGESMDRGGTVFFRWESLPVWCALEEVVA